MSNSQWTPSESTGMFTGCARLPNFDETITTAEKATTEGGYFSRAAQYVVIPKIDGTKKLKFYCDSLDHSGEGTVHKYGCGHPWNNNTTSLTYEDTTITEIEFAPTFVNARIVDFSYWFIGLTALSKIVNMQYMAADTSKVTDMSYMFAKCASLKAVDMTNVIMDEVTKTSYMFYACSQLKYIYCENTEPWAITQENSEQMFYGCTNLPNYGDGSIVDARKAYLNLGPGTGFFSRRTAKVLYTQSNHKLLFIYDGEEYGSTVTTVYTNLTNPTWHTLQGITTVEIDGSFTEVKPQSISHWFDGFNLISDITGLQYLNTSECTNFSYAFANCSSLPFVNGIKLLNVSNATNFTGMFQNCIGISSVDLSNWYNNIDSDDVTLESMFDGCSLLSTVTGGTFVSTIKPRKTKYLFRNTALNSLTGLTNFNATTITDATGMFQNCVSLTSFYINSDSWKFTNLETADYMFAGCLSLQTLVFPEAPKYLTLNHLCNNCIDLTTVTFTNDIGPKEMDYLFYNCSALTTVSKIECYATLTAKYAFYNTGITQYPDLGSGFTIQRDGMYYDPDGSYMFASCTGLVECNTTYTKFPVICTHMFDGCTSMTRIDLAPMYDCWYGSSAFDCKYLFNGCTSLTSIYGITGEPKWTYYPAVKPHTEGMFNGCTAIVGYDERYTDGDKAYVYGYFLELKPIVQLSYGEHSLRVNFYRCITPPTTTMTTYTIDQTKYVSSNIPSNTNIYVPAWIPKTPQIGISSGPNEVYIDYSMQYHRPTNVDYWFANMQTLSTSYFIGAKYLNLSKCTSMKFTFGITRTGYSHKDDYPSTQMNLASWDTSRVTTMQGIFSGKWFDLSKLHIRYWDTSNVTDLSYAFARSLYNFDVLKYWNLTKLISLNHTLANACIGLSKVDLSGKTTAIESIGYLFDSTYTPSSQYPWSIDMHGMTVKNLYPTGFENISSSFGPLTDIDMHGIKVTNGFSISYGFTGTNVTNSINLNSIVKVNTDGTESPVSISSGYSSFENCTAKEIDLGNIIFSTANGANYAQMFKNCNKLTTVRSNNKTKLNITGVTTTNMFAGCTSILHWDGTIDGSKATSLPDGYFTDCDVSKAVYSESDHKLIFYHDSITHTEGTAYELNTLGNDPLWLTVAENINTVEFSPSFANARPITCKSWFNGFSNLTTITNISNLNTEYTTEMESMFKGCKALPSIDVSTFNTLKVTTFASMFEGCEAFTTLNLTGNPFSTIAVTSISAMFKDCVALQTITFDPNFVLNNGDLVDMSSLFQGCHALQNSVVETIVNLFPANNYEIRDMSYAFADCTSLTEVDMMDTHLQMCRNLTGLFKGCTGLIEINISNFWPSNYILHLDSMYEGCTSLLRIRSTNTTPWSASSEFTSTNMFKDCPGLPQQLTTDNTYAYVGGWYVSGIYGKAIYTNNNTLTFYHDASKHKGSTVYLLNEGTDDPEWLVNSSTITTIVFDSSFENSRPTTCCKWFANMVNANVMTNIQYLNTSECTNMDYMFYSFGSNKSSNMMESLQTKDFDLTNVASAKYMFANCKIKYIYTAIDEWTIPDMENILTGSYVSGNYRWKSTVPKIGTMGGAFDDARTYRAIYNNGVLTFYNDLLPHTGEGTIYTNFDSRDTAPSWISDHANDITSVIFTSSCYGISPRGMYKWFYGCQSLNSVTGCENLNLTGTTTFAYAFQNCKSLVTIDMSGMRQYSLPSYGSYLEHDATSMFDGCIALKTVLFPSYKTCAICRKTLITAYMFHDCQALTTAPAIYLPYGNAITTHMYDGCSSLVSPQIALNAGGDSVYVMQTDYSYTFKGCSSLKRVRWIPEDGSDPPEDDNSAIKNMCPTMNENGMEGMFEGCISLEEMDLSNGMLELHLAAGYSTTSLNFKNMFKGCTGLITVNLGYITFTNGLFVVDGMFDGCRALETINGSNTEPWSVASSTNLFNNCTKLPNWDGTKTAEKAYYGEGGYFSLNLQYRAITVLLSDTMRTKYAGKTALIFGGFLSIPEIGSSFTYYGYNIGTVSGIYTLPTGSETPSWYLIASTIAVIIDLDSFFPYASTITSTHAWFKDFTNLEEVNSVTGIYSNVTDASNMFENCTTLETFRTQSFCNNTNNVNMSSMFKGCTALTNFECHYYGDYEVLHASDTSHMFDGCSSLTTFGNLRSSSSVYDELRIAENTDMSYMFNGCRSLTYIYAGNWDRTHMSNTDHMFDGCSALTTIVSDNIGSANAWTPTTSIDMFKGCTGLPNFPETPTAEDLSAARAYMEPSTATEPVGYFSDARAATVKYDDDEKTLTFYYDSKPHYGWPIPTSGSMPWRSYDTAKVIFDSSFANYRPTYCDSWFSNLQYSAGWVEFINMENLNTSECTSMMNMFSQSDVLYVDISSFDFSKVNNTMGMFYGCTSLREINATNTTALQIQSSDNMFYNCYDLYNFNSSITNAERAYAGGEGYFCASHQPKVLYDTANNQLRFTDDGRTYTDYQTFSLNTGTNDPAWLSVLSSITSVYFDKMFKRARPTTCYKWFYGTPSLIATTEDSNSLNLSECTNMSYMFANISNGLKINIDNSVFATTGKVTDMSYMFANTPKIRWSKINSLVNTTLPLYRLNTSSVTNMAHMFENCSSVKTFVFDAMDVSHVTDMTSMFAGCTTLQHIYAYRYKDIWDPETSTDMFNGCTLLRGYDEEKLDKEMANYDGGYFDPMPYMELINTTATFYTGGDHDRRGTIYPIYEYNEVSSEPIWNAVTSTFTKVVFNKSFVRYVPYTMASWFAGASQLKTVEGWQYLNLYDTAPGYNASCTYFYRTFYKCEQLKYIDLRNIPREVVTTQEMFSLCYALETVLIPRLHKMTGTSLWMFYQCSALKNIYNITSGTSYPWESSNSSEMFKGCTGLTYYDSTKTGTQKTYSIEYEGYLTPCPATPCICVNETQMEPGVLSNMSSSWGWMAFDIPNPGEEPGWIYFNPTLKELYSGGHTDTTLATVTSMDYWFKNTNHVDNSNMMFYFAAATNVTSMVSMLENAKGIEYAYMSWFPTTITNVDSLFKDCINLATVSWYAGSQYTITDSMFSGCSNLTTINASNTTPPSSIESSYNMFKGCTSLPNFPDTPTAADLTALRAHAGEGGYFTLIVDMVAVYNEDSCTLKFYHDGADHSAEGTVYTIPSEPGEIEAPGWYTDECQIKSYIIDSSFSDAKPMMCPYWFAAADPMMDPVTITGIEYLDTSECYVMAGMFANQGTMATIDVSGFDTSRCYMFDYMFLGCSAEIDISGFTFAGIEEEGETYISIQGMFRYYHPASKHFDARSIAAAFELSSTRWVESSMLFAYSNLIAIDCRGWVPPDKEGYLNLYDVFYNCANLRYVYVNSGENWADVPECEVSFAGCTLLKGYHPLYSEEKEYARIGQFLTEYGTVETEDLTCMKVVADSTTQTITMVYDDLPHSDALFVCDVIPYWWCFYGDMTMFFCPWMLEMAKYPQSRTYAFTTDPSLVSVRWMVCDYMFKRCTNPITSLRYLPQAESACRMFYQYRVAQDIVLWWKEFPFWGLSETFYNTQISGVDLSRMSYLPDDGDHTFDATFKECPNMEYVDLSGLPIDFECYTWAFDSCAELSIIRVKYGTQWNPSSLNTVVIKNCPNLPNWHSELTDPGTSQYAHCAEGGYFTCDNLAAIYNEGTLTFKYLADGEEFTGQRYSATSTTCYGLDMTQEPLPAWVLEHMEDITSVVFDESFADQETVCMAGWFAILPMLTSITGFENINLADDTSIQCMFYGTALSDAMVNAFISAIDVSKIDNMALLFCSTPLTSIDLSSWGPNIRNTINLFGMFASSQLETIDLTGWNITNGIYAMMFAQCENLTTIYGNNATAWIANKYLGGNSTITDPTQETFVECISLNAESTVAMPYDDTKIDSTYTHTGTTGYFTERQS